MNRDRDRRDRDRDYFSNFLVNLLQEFYVSIYLCPYAHCYRFSG